MNDDCFWEFRCGSSNSEKKCATVVCTNHHIESAIISKALNNLTLKV